MAVSADVKRGYYRHYKGGLYFVEGVARYSEDPHEQLVMYRSLYDSVLDPEGLPLPQGTLWARPLEMFVGDVTTDGKQRPRFAFLGETAIDAGVPDDDTIMFITE